MPFGDDEFAIFDVKSTDGKLEGTVASCSNPARRHQGRRRNNPRGRRSRFDSLDRALPWPSREPWTKRARKRWAASISAEGATRAGSKGPKPKKWPPWGSRPNARRSQIQGVKDPKERTAKLLELIKENPGHPMNASAYELLLSSAEAADLDPEAAAPRLRSGPTRPNRSAPRGRERCSRASSKPAREESVRRARHGTGSGGGQVAAGRRLVGVRGNLVNLLARSARLAGKDDVATEAESRAKEIDAKLDDEYHEKVPPFKPESYPDGRMAREPRRRHGDLTGAECPPAWRPMLRSTPCSKPTSRPSSSACSTTCTSPVPTR